MSLRIAALLHVRPASQRRTPASRLRCVASAGGAAEAAAPASYAFGVYVFGGGEGVRGALVDTATGAFVGEGVTTTLTSPSPDALSIAVAKLLTSAKWTGPVGVGMPGRVQARLAQNMRRC